MTGGCQIGKEYIYVYSCVCKYVCVGTLGELVLITINSITTKIEILRVSICEHQLYHKSFHILIANYYIL